jgi:hypothetical protein
MWVSDGIHMQATMRHQSRLSQLDLALATSLLYDLSLAVFFVIWYTRVPTVQSSQRFKIGE